MLNSIAITNFKAIGDDPLILNNLAKVNYLVGKNGYGKSSVLECLHIFSFELDELSKEREKDGKKKLIKSIDLRNYLYYKQLTREESNLLAFDETRYKYAQLKINNKNYMFNEQILQTCEQIKDKTGFFYTSFSSPFKDSFELNFEKIHNDIFDSLKDDKMNLEKYNFKKRLYNLKEGRNIGYLTYEDFAWTNIPEFEFPNLEDNIAYKEKDYKSKTASKLFDVAITP